MYDEVEDLWLNVTKNYTVYGNWTRTITETVTIDGLGQPTDTAISPNGKWMIVVTGYYLQSTNYGGYQCVSGNNECPTLKGYITIFKRDPSDGSLLFHTTER